MADEAFDSLLARRLAALHGDVPDDGFSSEVMGRVRALRARETPPAVRPAGRWPLALAVVVCAVPALSALLARDGGLFPGGTAAPVSPAADPFAGLLGLLQALPGLLEAHRYGVLAAALCAATLLLPQLLED